jgi:hypothetical protein
MAEDDDTRIPSRRRRDDMQDYGFMSEDDIERIVRRIVAELTRQFLTGDEIDKRIDQRSAQRWRASGFSVSSNPFESSQLEEDIRKFMDYLRGQHRKDVERAAKPFAMTLIVVQIAGGVATFGGLIWAMFSYLTGHFAWKG